MNKFRPWLEATGLALLYLLPLEAILLSPSRRSLYHQLLPITTVMRGLLLDILALALVGGIYFAFLKRPTSRPRNLLALPLFFVLWWVLSRDIAFASRVPPVNRFAYALPYLPYFWAVLLVLGIVLFVFSPRWFDSVTRATEVLLAAAGIACILVVLPRIALASFSHQPRESYQFNRESTLAMPPASSPRVVWILFDELSFNQVFDHRAAGLQLPAFDQMREQSTFFSHLTPVGLQTEVIIPGLFLGQQFSNIHMDKHDQLDWQSATHPQLVKYDPQQTIFGEAQRLGWSTGVAGWFNPYCRILAPVLNRCLWATDGGVVDDYFSHTSSGQSTLENAFYGSPIISSPAVLAWMGKTPVDDHRLAYEQVLAEGKSIIGDSKIRFAFIHLPVPHTPNIYRRPGTDSHHQPSYLDNLVVADRALAQLREAIAASPDAANTTLIVSSDHSWRTMMWRGVDWSPEDESASNGGVFDDRPVLMAHSPGQMESHRIDSSASLMTVHGLIEALLAGKLENVTDLDNYLELQAAH